VEPEANAPAARVRHLPEHVEDAAIASGGMPRPVSDTRTTTSPFAPTPASSVTWPAAVNLRALWKRFRTTVLSLPASVSITGTSRATATSSATSGRR
jgi:hypothetical protein